MTDKSVAMFITNDQGNRTQVGWASPATGGARTFELLKGHENVKLRDVSFEDDELALEEAESHPETTPTLSSAEVTPTHGENLDLTANVDAAPDEELADDPTDSGVELASGGSITDISDEEDQEIIRKELEAQESRDEDNKAKKEASHERRNRNGRR